MATTTIRAVELVRVGTWHASTGTTRITREDLAAVVAAHADPEIDHAPLKLGHTDKRFGDGEPALGWVENLRLADGGDTLLGDLVDVPAKLAEIAPAAYRRRSVELAFGVRTPAGKAYRAVLTGLALLGVSPPAVKGLADVLALYSGSLTVASQTAIEVVEGVGSAQTVAALDATRQQFAHLAEAHHVPADAIAAALAEVESAAGMRDTANLPPETPTPGDADAHEADASERGEPIVGLTNKQLAEIMGISEADLTEAKVRELLAKPAPATPATPAGAVPASATPVPVTPEAAGAAGTTPATTAETPVAATPAAPAAVGEAHPRQVAASAATPGTVVLTEATFADLQRMSAEWATQRRDGVIAAALSQGRITPAEEAAWRASLDANEAGTTALLAALAPRFSTVEQGSATAPTANLSEDQWAEFEKSTYGSLVFDPAAGS